jgi:hypothetical protein
MDVWCVCAFFCVCIVLCLGRGLATSWSPVQRVLPSVNLSRNWEISLMLQNGSKPPSGGKKGKKTYNSGFYSVNSCGPVHPSLAMTLQRNIELRSLHWQLEAMRLELSVQFSGR